MEEDIIYKDTLSRKKYHIEKRLEDAISKASEKIKYETAHDEQLLHALSIVREFIKKKQRVCYGGTAMNAILPKSKQFYNPETDLPDYDFYTPDVDGDVKDLVSILEKEGFEDVYSKVGIHEGTKKVLVNFTAIADISHIDPELFGVIYRRSILKDGVHYTDQDILRMMMYLELSRPKGMPERWTKVFERLDLINQIFPIEGCSRSAGQKESVSLEIRRVILNYIIKWKRILCNGPIIPLYQRGIRRYNAVFRIQEGGPILMTSPDPKLDSAALKSELSDPEITLIRHRARGEIVPERIELSKGGKTICIIVQEIACHSYVPFPTSDKRTIFIGSLEFLITLFLSLMIFTQHGEEVLGPRIICQVKELIKLSRENYGAKKSQFDPFSTLCRGHQTKYSSLLREKFKRQRLEKGATRRKTLRPKQSTRKSANKNSTDEPK